MLLSKKCLWRAGALVALAAGATGAWASEAELALPELGGVRFSSLGNVSGFQLMLVGILVCAIGLVFGLFQYNQTKNLPVHDSMYSQPRHSANLLREIFVRPRSLFIKGDFCQTFSSESLPM